MFNLGIVGVQNEGSDITQLACGCRIEYNDPHAVTFACDTYPHPSARFVQSHRSIFVHRGLQTRAIAYVDKDQAKWIKKEIAIMPAIEWLTKRVQKEEGRLRPFVREILLYYITHNFQLTSELANMAIVRYNSRQHYKRKLAKERNRNR